MKTINYLLGLLFIILGVIGIFIPVWPTTPFILLAMFFFSKSNSDYNEFIMNNKWVGHHIRNYSDNRTMTNSFKVKTLIFLWVGLCITMILQSNYIIISLLMIIGISVSLHIMYLKKT